MRSKEDNLLKIANSYKQSLINDGFCDSFTENDLADNFDEIISDYRRLLRLYKKEGIEISDSLNVNDELKEFEVSDIDDKEDIIERMKDRIQNMIKESEVPPPAKLVKKYCEDSYEEIEVDED